MNLEWAYNSIWSRYDNHNDHINNDNDNHANDDHINDDNDNHTNNDDNDNNNDHINNNRSLFCQFSPVSWLS
ncbi:hypothetical protein WR25_22679 [Diploscapter pachys]|uniref:Uncharacterized protein n=1 Tax=Diploscapter pachys TaxID=2018661 RepID=A0A2A2KNQ8_9BILA|nr:hypothetical protein WR25_22679 [Diploscapter pachys]